MALRKEDLLFKKVFAKKAITESAADQPFFQEPYTAPLSLESNNILTETTYLPAVAPSAWVASASYSQGDIVYYDTTTVNTNMILYEAIIAHSGVATIPSSDTTNWKVFPYAEYAFKINMPVVTGAPYAFQSVIQRQVQFILMMILIHPLLAHLQ